MSETIEATIPGDWRILAGILDADLRRAGCSPISPAEEHDGYHVTVFGAHCQVTADVLFRAVGGSVYIQVKTHPDQAMYWQRELRFLADAVIAAVSFDELTRASAIDVIETYYRRKAAGSKVTIRQLAEETGYSMAYLKTAKRRYDAAGRWGSKKKPLRAKT